MGFNIALERLTVSFEVIMHSPETLDIMSEAISKECLDFQEAESSVGWTLSRGLGRESGLGRFQETLSKKTKVI